MIKLELDKRVIPIEVGNELIEHFSSPIIFYLMNRNDKRPLLVNFVIINFEKKQLEYYDTFLEENNRRISDYPEQDILVLLRTPHRTVTINKGEDFFTFIQEEQYFYYINYKKQFAVIYTFDDFIKHKDYKLLKISSTNYIDTKNPDYMYLSAIDDENNLHIYRVSLTLQEIEEIHIVPNQIVPPHTLRKYKDLLLLSHDFGNAQFYKQNSKTIISSTKFAMMLQKKKAFAERKRRDQVHQNISVSPRISELFNEINSEDPIVCSNGEVLIVNLENMEETFYKTTGTSPAHFEIDEEKDIVYVSSHNFFVWNGKNIYVDPAVLDKYKLENGGLHLEKSFSHRTGFRFTSHKLFYHQGKPYMCTFGQPNRLFIIDAEEMELLYYQDIGKDELTDQSSIRDYLNDRRDEFEIVGIEVSQSGEYLLFICNQYIYIYEFAKREVILSIPYLSNTCDDERLYAGLDQYKIRTNHIDYL